MKVFELFYLFHSTYLVKQLLTHLCHSDLYGYNYIKKTIIEARQRVMVLDTAWGSFQPPVGLYVTSCTYLRKFRLAHANVKLLYSKHYCA